MLILTLIYPIWNHKNSAVSVIQNITSESTLKKLLLTFFCAATFSLVWADQSVVAPDVHVGNWWRYQTVDGFTNEPSVEFTHRIVDINEREITVQLKNKNVKASELRYYNRDWNSLDVGTAKFEPYYPGLKFPMMVGNKWKEQYRITATNGKSSTAFMVGSVSALEKVTVPAGVFEAYRIESHADSHLADESADSSQGQKISWYAPAIKNIVRSEVTVMSGGRVRSKSVTQLVEYSLEEAAK